MPAYNCEKIISNAVESVTEGQAYENLELIIIDDNSTDSTWNLITKLQNTYPQIVVKKNDRSKGPSGARNVGLLTASGEYLSFLDADDVWLPGHLNYGVAFLQQHPDIDVVFYNFNIVDYNSGQIIANWFSEREFTENLRIKEMADGYHLIDDDLVCALLSESFLHLQSMILRTTVCRSILFNENISRAEDRDFGIRLNVEANASFAYHPSVTGIYYRHPTSLTSQSLDNKLSTIDANIYLLSTYLSCPKFKKHSTYMQHILYRKYLSKAFLHRKKSEYRAAAVAALLSMNHKIGYKAIKELLKIGYAYLALKKIGDKTGV